MSAASPRSDRTDLPHEAHLILLASLDGVGPARLRWLLSLGSPPEVWRAVAAGTLPPPPMGSGITTGLARQWRAQAASMDPVAAWDCCARLGIGVVSLGGAGYPPVLADDRDPPVVLFHLGDPDVLGAPRVAIIGTRRATGYGVRTAQMLGRELAEAGVAVVSGLALGIDAAAHRGATSALPGRGGAGPVAVVGGGLDAPCPVRNRRLADEVVRTGVVLSEVPPGVAAAPWRFPVRNRILAALGEVVVVVESAAAGGSMHTVREALERNRPVLAVPGPVDSLASEGTNQLLSEGAHPCLRTEDVLMALGHSTQSTGGGSSSPSGVVAPPADTGTQRRDARPEPTGDAALVLEALGWRPTSPERLATLSGLAFRPLSAALAELERLGWVTSSGGWVERVARGIPAPRPPDA
jgi:DNA processing protein